jgi:hypothetical protein
MSKKEVKRVRAFEESIVILLGKARLSARHTSATLLRVAVAALVAEQMPRQVALIAMRESLTNAIAFFNNERAEKERDT